MKMITVIEIDAGKETCASEPGKFCNFLGTTNFGTRNVCLFFRDANSKSGATELRSKEGWVHRCTACKSAFKQPE